MGIEPSTHHVLGDLAARERGEMIWLEHGDSREYRLELEGIVGEAALGAMVDEIDGLG